MKTKTQSGTAPANALRRFAVAAAVLLTLCLVFMMPVGAANHAVADEAGLKTALDDSEEWTVITLTDSFSVQNHIDITRSNVMIDGQGFTISAGEVAAFTQEHLRLLRIEGAENAVIENVTLKGITFDNAGSANGLVIKNAGSEEKPIILDNIVVKDSHVSGITMQVKTVVKANDVTVENSAMMQSIDIQTGSHTLDITGDTANLKDSIKIGDSSKSAVITGAGDYNLDIKEGVTIFVDYLGNPTDIATLLPEFSIPRYAWMKNPIEDVKSVLDTWLLNAKEEYASTPGLDVSTAELNAVAAVESNGVVSVYADLQAAVNAAESGETVTLLDDVVLTSEIHISESGITLKGNNEFTISPSAKDTLGGSDQYLLRVSGTDFTMTNVVIDDIRVHGDAFLAAVRLDSAATGATLTGNTIYAGDSAQRSAGILVEGPATGTQLTGNVIYLGEANVNDYEEDSNKYRNESIGIRIYPATNSGGTEGTATNGLVISGNTIERTVPGTADNWQVGILIDGAQPGDSITVTGGNTFELGETYSSILEIVCERLTDNAAHPSLDLTFSGNTITSAENYLYLLKDEIDGEPFTQTMSISNNGNNAIGEIKLGSGVTLALTSGTFSADPSEYVTTPYRAKEISTGVWEVNTQYTITFVDGGSIINAITLNNGTSITEPENPTKTGYTFAGWNPAIPATMPAEDMTITAQWTINQYTITFNTDGGTEIAPIKQDYNTAVTAPANPTKSGYTFQGWDTEIPATMPAEDLTITAEWKKKSSSSGGSSSSSSSTEKPVEPETPVEPEAGEVTVETTVTNGGEVSFETPAAEGSEPAADAPVEVEAVVLPEGTAGEVSFIPVSEQPAPAGKEKNTKKVFEINVPKYDAGKPATIKFTMTVAELTADGKTAAEVALWHFDEETGEWTKLLTTFTIVDGVVYFEAITFDFSPFAIVYEDVSAPAEPETPEQPTESPAPILAVLAGLGAAVVLRRK